MRSLPEQMAWLAAAIRGETRPASQGLRVYHHAYRARLEGVLATHYPVLARVMGREDFRRLAEAYADRFPSHHWSVRWHGEHLHEVLGPGPLADLARMEWALGTAFDAADEPAVEIASLMHVPPERWSTLAFALHPSVRVLFLDHAVERLWRSAREHPDGPWEEAIAHAHALVVWREAFEPHWRTATVGEGEALLRLHEHRTLEAAGERLDAAGARALGEWFAGWAAQGLLVSPERGP